MKGLNLFIFFSSTLVFFGCSTPGDLSKRKAQIEFDTEKDINLVVSCVSKSWAEYTSYISSLTIENGSMLSIMHHHAGVDATAVITVVNKKTHVHYVERIPSLTPSWMRESVKSCR